MYGMNSFMLFWYNIQLGYRQFHLVPNRFCYHIHIYTFSSLLKPIKLALTTLYSDKINAK